LILLEQIVRQATLGGTAEARAKLMQLVPLNLFMQVNEGLRQTFFEDAVAIMERDQYIEVNLLTPAITKVQGALPPEIRHSYIKALISQAKSGAWQGSARRSGSALQPAEGVGSRTIRGARWKDPLLGVAKPMGQAILEAAPIFLAHGKRDNLRGLSCT
jgi:hypothetical protein